jgi:hypothetical protein
MRFPTIRRSLCTAVAFVALSSPATATAAVTVSASVSTQGDSLIYKGWAVDANPSSRLTPMVRALASIYEPARAGAIALETIEVYEQMVIVRWRSLDAVDILGPEGEAKILITDDRGTAYTCAETGTNFTDGSRGICWFVPGPPEGATLRVATPQRSYELGAD